MLTSLWFILPISAVLGFLSGLGTGGGSLLILWLTLALHMDPAQARTINLMFFIPSALISVLFRHHQGKIPVRKLLPAIAAGCAAAFLVSRVAAGMDLAMLKKLFGGLLIFTGIRELRYKKEVGQ